MWSAAARLPLLRFRPQASRIRIGLPAVGSESLHRSSRIM